MQQRSSSGPHFIVARPAPAAALTAEHLPTEEHKVQGYFQHRGAYGRFKGLLERSGRLEQWYEYEREVTTSALLAWAAEEGINVAGGAPTDA